MGILKALWNRFVFKKNGSGLQSSTNEKICSDVQNAFDSQERFYPFVQNLGTKNQKLGYKSQSGKFIALSSLIFLVSCGSATKPDPAPPYTDGNYHSVEMELCGKTFFGVGGCHFQSGVSAVAAIGIQGFYTGEVSIFSDLCHIDWKQRYGLNEKIEVQLSQLYGHQILQRTDSCTLKVVVSPDPIKGSEEAIFPRVGEVYIEVRSLGVDKLILPSLADQVRESELQIQDGMSVSLPGESGQYQLTRCSEPALVGSFDGSITLPSLQRKTSCKYQLAVRAVSGKKYSAVFFRNVFAKNAVLLARPVVTRSTGKICIESDPSTSTYMSINDTWESGNKLCADGKGPFKIRVFTTKRNYFEIVP